MKKTFSQTATLDVFFVDLDQLVRLWGIVLGQFADCGALDSSLILRVPGRTLEFSDADDLRKCTELPDEWSDFELSVHGGGSRSLRLVLNSQTSSRATVSATAGADGWCGGMIGTIATFLNTHRPWYYWVYRINEGASLSILLGIGFFAPSLLTFAYDALGQTIEFQSFAVMFAALAVGLLVSVMRWFMPRSVVIVATRPSILHRRYREIMFVLALAAVIFNLLALLD